MYSLCCSNIDIRIRQAELEYALGREELQLLSLVEEIRALQCRLDKSLITNTPRNPTSLYYHLSKGLNMSLYAINANVRCFGLSIKDDGSGIFIEWVSDGESLLRGDRIIECNGRVLSAQSKEEIQNLLSLNNKCELVVIRTNQMLSQSQEDNRRLQHRISYLEDQVKEMQTKDIIPAPEQKSKPVINRKSFKGDHVTRIDLISCDKPQIFQRGNYIATIIGGKAIQTTSNPPISEAATTTNMSTMNKLVGCVTSGNIGFGSTSKISINNSVNSSHSFLKQKDKNITKHYKENHRMHRGQSDRHNSQPDLLYVDVSYEEYIFLRPIFENYFHIKILGNQVGK